MASTQKRAASSQSNTRRTRSGNSSTKASARSSSNTSRGSASRTSKTRTNFSRTSSSSGRKNSSTTGNAVYRRKKINNQVTAETKEEVLIFILFAFFIFVLLCMINVIKGFLGEAVKEFMLGVFGIIGYLVPLFLLAAFLFKIANKNNPIASIKLISAIALIFVLGIFICFLSSLDIAQISESDKLINDLYESQTKAGIVFGLCAVLLYKGLGTAGSWFVCIIIAIVAILLLTEKNFLRNFFSNHNPFNRDYFDYEDDYDEEETGQYRHRLTKEEIIARDEAKRKHDIEEKRRDYEERLKNESSGKSNFSKETIQDQLARIEEKIEEKKEEKREEKERLLEDKRKLIEEKERLKDLKDDQRILNSSIKDKTKNYTAISLDMNIPLIEEKIKYSKDDIHEITIPYEDSDNEDFINKEDNSLINEEVILLNNENALINNNYQGDIDISENSESFDEELNLENKIIENIYSDDNSNKEFNNNFNNNLANDLKNQFNDNLDNNLKNHFNNNLNNSLNDNSDNLKNEFKNSLDNNLINNLKDSLKDNSENNCYNQINETKFQDVSNMPEPVTEKSHEGNEKPDDKPKPQLKSYVYPSFDLLTLNKFKNNGDSDDELKTTALKLKNTLKTFGVDVNVSDISQGPSVTRYELTLAEGTKVSKIVGLQDDIKLNLAAQDIRIEAPIPGKAAVGIEIPNKVTSSVLIRDILETKEFDNAESKITFAVGKDISGKTIVADIAKMPHMLIAGATGSGKSVCINTLIMSILYKADPKLVKLIMIDPKVVELSVYNGIPHLLLPVVTDPKKASAALQWAVNEMTKRYNAFASLNVRDLKGYNQKIKDLNAKGDDTQKPKPQIIVIVDELADLMMVASKEVEESICRLAQLARAAGIHLIIATQRPSVDVITGLIKANMPSRVAFKVSSGVDSRTILDMVGAEKLLGKGDMLFYPQGYSKPLRIQGAFVSDDEVGNVVDFLKSNAGDNVYDEEVEKQIAGISNGGSGNLNADSSNKSNDLDPYFEEACKLVVEKEKASSGMLQRVYKIGFNRAARIIDQMESYGVVGPEEGTKPRRVLMTISELEDLLESI